MTNRFVRIYEKIRDRLGGRRKLALAVVALWITFELLAAAAVAVAGKEWLETSPAKTDGGGTSALGFSASHSAPSIAVF